ncbi:MAG: N-acetylmuramoyl-L-alanine amidase [Bacteroidota bacterium]
MPRFSWLLPVIFLILFSVSLPAQRRSAIQTVVIDAGHGGHDPGAIGLHAREKNINLAIALKLGGLIRRTMKDVRVIYTRDKDNFVELHRRAEIANENKADLFICIHCNANPNHSLKGAETYVMGLHKSQANLNIAKLENASILLESDYQSTYNGFDPNADESYIIFSLYQNSNLDQSTDLATAIQAQLEKRHGSAIHGVRQAGFMVLYKTAMPSVLVETGYISNPEEELFLMSDLGQDHVVTAIFKAFKSFRENVANPVKAGQTTTGDDSLKIKAAAVAARQKKSTGGVVNEPEKTDSSPAAIPAKPGLSFRVQVAATVDKLDSRDSRLVRFSNVKVYRHRGMYKYTVGDASTLPGAEEILKEVKQKGVADAFIVIFRNGTRIPNDEAGRLLGK